VQPGSWLSSSLRRRSIVPRVICLAGFLGAAVDVDGQDVLGTCCFHGIPPICGIAGFVAHSGIQIGPSQNPHACWPWSQIKGASVRHGGGGATGGGGTGPA